MITKRSQITLKPTQVEQINKKLKLLSEVTFNLKCAAFKIVDLPIDNFKLKINTFQSSLFTTLDSIFHDLKRVETLLTQHSRTYQLKTTKNLSINSNLQQNERQFVQKNCFKDDFKQYQRPNLAFTRQNFGFQRQTSQINLNQDYIKNSQYYEQRRDNLKKTKKINHNITLSAHCKNYQTQINQLWSDKSQINHNFLAPQWRAPKKQHQNINISKVSSSEYLGFPQNPVINIKAQIIKQSPYNSPPHSQISYSKASVDWKSIHMEQNMKDKQNEEFIRYIKRKRQTYLKSISKKKQKCLDTIEKINSKIINQRQRSVSGNRYRARQRRKSKTQKFKKIEYQKDQIKENNVDYPAQIYDGF